MAFAKFRNSAIGLTLIAALGLPLGVMAQTAVPEALAGRTEIVRTETGAAVTLPAALANLGLTEVTAKNTRRGKMIEGKLDGRDLRAMSDAEGALRAVMMKEGALPAAVMQALLPQPVRDAQVLAQFSEINGLRLGNGNFGVMGKDGEGQQIGAQFAQDGTLLRFGRGEGHGKGEKGGKDGKRGKHDGKKGGPKDGKQGMKHDRMGQKAGKGAEGKGPQDKRGQTRGQGGPAPLDDAALRAAAEQAGYTAPGEIFADGPRRLLNATNPQGEPVTIEINPRGQVVRETAR